MKEIYNLFIQTQTSEIENAYNKLLLYGQEVADFLLYVRDKRSEALILGSLLFQYNASEYVFSDGKIYRQSYLYAKYLDLSRNTVSWLNAANSYLDE